MGNTVTICFANNKGGSGKSTSCSNVGAALAGMGKKVLLVDGDMQLNLSLSFFDEEEVLKMAVTGGAKAMGLTDCDCLAEGKKADLIMIDLNQPNMQPINNPMKNLVYSGSKQNVKMTMINGKILYEDQKFFIGVEPKEVYKKANEIITRMRQS